MSIDEKSLKACHLWKKVQDESASSAVILKFVHFRAKDTVYCLRKTLSKYLHPLNGKLAFNRQRLPYHQVELKKAADSINLTNTTHNCQVKKLVKQGDWKFAKQINDLKQLEVEWQRTKLLSNSSTSEGAFFQKREQWASYTPTFSQFDVSNPNTPPCKRTRKSTTGPKLKYNEVQTPLSGNGASNKSLINYWPKKNQKWKLNLCADDKASWNPFSIEYETICSSNAKIHSNCKSLLKSFECL